jgi:hypothetical protein
MPDITIKLDQDKFNSMLINGTFLDVKYEIKDVTINDDFFKDDSLYEQLKKASIKAYKDLKIYEFNKRNKQR